MILTFISFNVTGVIEIVHQLNALAHSYERNPLLLDVSHKMFSLSVRSEFSVSCRIQFILGSVVTCSIFYSTIHRIAQVI